MDNQTQIIEKNDWAAFAEEFSKQHAGETAVLEMLGDDVGDQYAAENLPFVGMTLESKGSSAGSLVLMLGTEGKDSMERFVAGLQSLQMHTSPDGETVLKIEAEDEPALLLHLAPLTALPTP